MIQTLWPFLTSHFIVGNYFCGLFDDVHALHIFVLAHLLKESIHFFYDPKKSEATFLYVHIRQKGGHRLIISVPALDLFYTLVDISDRSGPAIRFLGTRNQASSSGFAKFLSYAHARSVLARCSLDARVLCQEQCSCLLGAWVWCSRLLGEHLESMGNLL